MYIYNVPEKKHLNSMDTPQANIYTVEGVIMSAVGVGWCEIFAALTIGGCPLNSFAFYVIGIAALLNLFLCTVVSAQKIQVVFMSLVMGITASYIWVAAKVLTAESIQTSAYAQYFLGSNALKDLFPTLSISISLALLLVQTLIAAAAVTPNLWTNPATGPTVIMAVFLSSGLKYSGILGAVVYGLLALGEVLTYSANRATAPFILLCVALGFQVGVLFGGVIFLTYQVSSDHASLAVLVVESVLIGIPVLASGTRCINTGAAVVAAMGREEHSDSSTAAVPQKTSIESPPQMQTAFYTTEANLFRATPLTAEWAPKKHI